MDQDHRNARAARAWRELAAYAAEQARYAAVTDPTETFHRRGIACAIEGFARLGDELLAAAADQVGHGDAPWELLVETTQTLVDRIRTCANREDELVRELAWEGRALESLFRRDLSQV
jgi:hypothetical protein